MVEAEFLLELLVHLFANPAHLDGAGDVLDRGVGGKVGEIVFSLAVRAMLTHQPSLFAWHMLCASSADPPWRTIGDTHTHGRKASRQAAFGPSAPTDRSISSMAMSGFV